MKKLLLISTLCILFGLVCQAISGGTGRVQARRLAMLPVQVQSTGYTDSKGTIIVSATCPQNYHVRSGSAQITPSSQNQGAYSIVSNGPNSERKAWVVSVENKAAGSLSITVTVTCTY